MPLSSEDTATTGHPRDWSHSHDGLVLNHLKAVGPANIRYIDMRQTLLSSPPSLQQEATVQVAGYAPPPFDSRPHKKKILHHYCTGTHPWPILYLRRRKDQPIILSQGHGQDVGPPCHRKRDRTSAMAARSRGWMAQGQRAQGSHVCLPPPDVPRIFHRCSSIGRCGHVNARCRKLLSSLYIGGRPAAP